MFILHNNQPNEICTYLDQKLFQNGQYQQFYCFLEYSFLSKKFYLYQNFFDLNDSYEAITGYEKRTCVSIDDLNSLFEKTDMTVFAYFQELVQKKREIDFKLDTNRLNQTLSNIAFVKDVENVGKAQQFLNSITEEYKKEYNYFTNNENLEQAKKKADAIAYNFEKSNIEGYVVRVFNVGQANCSAVFVNKNPNSYFVFDIGDCNSNNKLRDFLKNMNSNGFVVISHYDNDHINMYKSLGKKALKRVFIIHELPCYKRTLVFLSFIKKLYKHKTPLLIVKDDSLKSNSLTIGNYLSIYQGETLKMSKYQSTIENTHSLVGKIKINGKIAVFPGDALEEEFDIGEKRVDLFMISHHGCKYDGKVAFNVEMAHLFVTHKCNYRYKHPDLNHINFFKSVQRFGDSSSLIYKGNNRIQDTYTIKIDNNKDSFDYQL